MSNDTNPNCTKDCDVESSTGTDCSIAFTSGTNDGSNIASRTWASVSSTDAGSTGVVFALVAEESPTVVLNSPADASSDSDTTPTLDFTGTDAETDSIEYNIHIDTVNTFDQLFLDDFTRANSSTLGNGWTEDVGDWAISSNTLSTPVSDGAIASNSAAPGSADYSVEVAATMTSTLDFAGVAIRFTDTTHFYLFQMGTQVAQLYVNNAGFTLLDSTSFGHTAGTTYVIKIEAVGTTIRGYIDGVLMCSAVNAALSTAGTGALRRGNPNAALVYDNYTVKDPTLVLLNKVSTTDAGFVNPDTGGDTHPFNSGENIQYTVQGGDALSTTTYYWRVRGTDPAGSNIYGAWSSTRSFTVTAGGTTYVNSYYGPSGYF